MHIVSFRDCWYGYKHIPCDKFFKKMIINSTTSASASTMTKPLIAKICSQLNGMYS